MSKKKVEAKADIKINIPVKFKIVDKKSDGEQGIVEAYVSIFGNVDFAGDIIQEGAFAKSLLRKLPKGVWAHDWEKPIAKTLEAKETSKGLYIKGQFNLETQRGKESFSDIKFGTIDEFSIGFRITDEEYNDKGIRIIKEAELYEWSPVLVGANPETHPISVKSKKKNEEKNILEDEMDFDQTDQNKKWKMIYKVDDIFYKFFDVYLRATTKSSDFKSLTQDMSEMFEELAKNFEEITADIKDFKPSSNESKVLMERMEKIMGAKQIKKLDFVKVKKDTVELFYKRNGEKKVKTVGMSNSFKKYNSERKTRKQKVATDTGKSNNSKTILRIRNIAKKSIKSNQHLLRITKS